VLRVGRLTSFSSFHLPFKFEKLKQPLTLVPHRASEAAIAAVEASGGTDQLVYQGYLRMPDALPMKKRDILYYTNWSVPPALCRLILRTDFSPAGRPHSLREKRGYLAQRPADFDPMAAAARVLVQPEPRTMHETTAAYPTGKGR
jgi:hypothetical protein